MSKPITLTGDEVNHIKETLLVAKFALEQDVDGAEKSEALKAINRSLDVLRKE